MAEEKPKDDQRYFYEMNRRDAERAHDAQTAFVARVDEAAVSTGIFAIRTALLINGGAAVSILAFIGGLASQGRVGIASLSDMASSLSWFAGGVALAGMSAGAAYFTVYFQRRGSDCRHQAVAASLYRPD